jgi:hypothetical protein
MKHIINAVKEYELYENLKGNSVQRYYAIKADPYGFLLIDHPWFRYSVKATSTFRYHRYSDKSRMLNIAPKQHDLASIHTSLPTVQFRLNELTTFKGGYYIDSKRIKRPIFSIVEFIIVPISENI